MSHQTEPLVEATLLVARELCGIREQLQIANNNNAILNRMEKMENKIMSAISDFLAKQVAFNTRQDAAANALAESLAGLTEDVQTLNDKITELQNSPGGVTPEDQITIDALESQGEALSARLEAFATALQALNALTPPKVPVTPP